MGLHRRKWMGAMAAAAVLAAAEVYATASGEVLVDATPCSRHWTTVFTNEVPLAWNWVTNATGARLDIAGMNGTLETRFEEAPVRGNVNAKTGSLGHVSTLAGVLTTESGQNLVFAVGNDHVPNDGAYWTRIYLDEFVTFLTQS